MRFDNSRRDLVAGTRGHRVAAYVQLSTGMYRWFSADRVQGMSPIKPAPPVPGADLCPVCWPNFAPKPRKAVA